LTESTFFFLPGRFISHWLRVSQVTACRPGWNIATPGGGWA